MSSNQNDNDRLRELERQLAADDPGLADALRHFRLTPPAPHHRWLGPTAWFCAGTLALLCLVFDLPPSMVMLATIVAVLALIRQVCRPPQGRHTSHR